MTDRSTSLCCSTSEETQANIAIAKTFAFDLFTSDLQLTSMDALLNETAPPTTPTARTSAARSPPTLTVADLRCAGSCTFAVFVPDALQPPATMEDVEEARDLSLDVTSAPAAKLHDLL